MFICGAIVIVERYQRKLLLLTRMTIYFLSYGVARHRVGQVIFQLQISQTVTLNYETFIAGGLEN